MTPWALHNLVGYASLHWNDGILQSVLLHWDLEKKYAQWMPVPQCIKFKGLAFSSLKTKWIHSYGTFLPAFCPSCFVLSLRLKYWHVTVLYSALCLFFLLALLVALVNGLIVPTDDIIWPDSMQKLSSQYRWQWYTSINLDFNSI